MTDIERRALLGDPQAQEECTRRGIVLPCPIGVLKRLSILYPPPTWWRCGTGTGGTLDR